MTGWRTAEVLSIREEAANTKTFELQLDESTGHAAGQHVVVRLTAPDGYRAQRSYSIATAPDGSGRFDLTVERLADGEVSSFLHDEVRPGDQLEVGGPIGGWFVWDGTPALLLGGGSGVVPLMAMLRQARIQGNADDLRLVVSVRTPEDLYYRDEIAGPQTTIVYTRSATAGTSRPPGRVTADDLRPLLRDGATTFVCGSHRFADAMTDLLSGLGVAPSSIRVERFGPSADPVSPTG